MSGLFKYINKLRRPFCTMVVVAAGSSARMGEDKLFIELGGMPVLARTLLAIEKSEYVDEIIVVTRSDLLEKCAKLCIEYGIEKAGRFLLGGSDRLHSALAGAVEASGEAKLIGIHDGARPFVSQALIERVIRCAAEYDAAVPALPVHDTVKIAVNGIIETTLERENVVSVQTPQVFTAELIKCALTSAVENGLSITDDSSAVEELGVPVRTVAGEADNIKLTTPNDLELAEVLLRRVEDAK